MKKEEYLESVKYNNIKELLYNSVEKYAENTAYILKHKEKEVSYENISYKRLLEEINALGTKLFELGYKNKRIAIVGRNRYEWVLAHLTNLLGGIVSIPLDKELQIDELESCLVRSKADVVVFDEKYIEKIEEIKHRNNTNLQEYICMSKHENYLDIISIMQEGKKLVEQNRRDYIDMEIDNDKMNILLFTSGTTSKAKAVMLSQKNIASNIYGLFLVEKFYETDVNLAFLPFHHIFASTAMLVMLNAGLATAFPDGLRYVAQNLKEYKVSVFVGVPLLIESIYKKIEHEVQKQGKTKMLNIAKKISNFLLFFNIDVRKKLFKDILEALGGHMRFIIAGGAPLDKRVCKGFNELGVKLVQGYGLTETSPVLLAENEFKVKYGSVGVPLPNVEIEIENPDDDGIGELKAKGPNIMLGYYENTEATNEVIRDGWFYTGDLAYKDKKGFVFITGRKKDMIVLKNGKKIFPEEIEIMINNLEEVKECMVFGMPENGDQNNLKLSVKIVYNKEYFEKNHEGINEDDIKKIIWEKIKEVNKTFPSYKYIKNMILTDEELIKTTTLKIKRNEEMKKILV